MSDIVERIRDQGCHLDAGTIRTLEALYDPSGTIVLGNGAPVTIDKSTRISIEQGALLHKLVRDNSVTRSLEIGFAYGFSTVWILGALRGQANAAHTSIDPFEMSDWHGVGLALVEKVGFEGKFQWIKDFSIHALSDLIRRKETFDFVFIDGNHRFDDVIVDFYLSDQVLRPGGLIVLDDMWMDSIETAVDFIVKNRNYELVPTPVSNISVLRKLRDDDRNWNHFIAFSVTKPGSWKRWLRKIARSAKSRSRNLLNLS